MIDTAQLSQATCQVFGSKDGTGFFVGAGLVLTCGHLVTGLQKDATVKVQTSSGQLLDGVLKSVCQETDLAVIYVGETHPDAIPLIDCAIPVGLEYASYGHPDTHDGNLVGEPLHGRVIRVIDYSTETKHDVSLSSENMNINPEFQGFSGSGIINAQGNIFAILRFSNSNYVSAVSIRKAADFLSSEGILVKKGELDDFKGLIEEAFGALDEGVREWCKATGKQIAQKLTPQLIVETLKGTLFYPVSEETVKDIITRLVNSKQVNQVLWLGWLRFLTFISLLKNDHEDINKITISLGAVEFTKLMDVDVTPIALEMTVSLNLLFAETGNFISITGEYLAEKLVKKELDNNSCHVFDSSNTLFGHRVFTAQNKENIITNIAGGNKAGYRVPGKLNFGVISMQQLSNEIGRSQNIPEATLNLKNLFTNVLN
jgi:Trypsin-like peptidase domain